MNYLVNGMVRYANQLNAVIILELLCINGTVNNSPRVVQLQIQQEVVLRDHKIAVTI